MESNKKLLSEIPSWTVGLIGAVVGMLLSSLTVVLSSTSAINDRISKIESKFQDTESEHKLVLSKLLAEQKDLKLRLKTIESKTISLEKKSNTSPNK